MTTIMISKALATVTESEILTSGMVNAKVKFEFSADWTSSLSKTAIFTAGDVTKAVLETYWEDNVCSIPQECLEKSDEILMVGVYGADNANKVAIPTVWATVGKIRKGYEGYEDVSTGTLPIWAQVQSSAAQAAAAAETAQGKAEEAVAKAEPLVIVITTAADGTATADKTYDEVRAAISSGKRMIAALKNLGAFEVTASGLRTNAATIHFGMVVADTTEGLLGGTWLIGFDVDFASDGTVSVVTADEDFADYYKKPSTGIPKSDLASDVQASLGKAETAQEAAEAAQGKAETAQEAAEAAQGKAETAQEAAEAAQGKAETAQEAAANSATEAADWATTAATAATDAATQSLAAADSATLAKSWAVGGTGTRDGEDTNNAKYWAQVAVAQAVPYGAATVG